MTNNTIFGSTKFYSDQKPVPDNVFQVYKELFSYDKTDLNALLESTDSSDNWVHEKISFDAAYNNERIVAHLFLPKNTLPPFQTVIYYPGGPAFLQKSSENIENYFEFYAFLSFIIKNGRAVLFPVYKGTFERNDQDLIKKGKLHKQIESDIQTIKDFRRCIDYLDTRNDIDTGKLALYHISIPGPASAILAVEKRIKVCVLISVGLIISNSPEISQINYLPRVKTPTIMLNGKYDMIFPYNLSIKPMFDLLGTSKKDKELKLFNTDHIPPEKGIIKETLAWLDKYLGPVK